MPELTRRYIVMAMATEAPFDATDSEGAFVLKPWKDPAALRALETYRDNCYPELARELDDWIRAIKQGPTFRGGVGKRNEPRLKPAKAEPRRALAKAKAVTASKSRPGQPRSRKKPAGRKR